ncbi:MAG: hypothetical protein ACR2HE_04795 [Casimicrobiaceae bacterium]
MSGHFAAFSFVDRITEYEPGQRAYGGFKVPATITAFPSCLVAEAVGQLAAWVAMAHVGFRARPVAALALETRFVRDVMPGSALELAVALDSCDDAAVAYSGHARVDGATVIELHDCLGPMLDIEQFESPAVLRDRFALLCGAGAEPGRFQGVMTPNLMVTTELPGQSVRATLLVPAAAPFFADHFPRRPVYPATLLLERQIELALRLAGGATEWHAGESIAPVRMTNVKMRAFIEPGQRLELGADMAAPIGETAKIALSARTGERQVATAQVEIGRRQNQ